MIFNWLLLLSELSSAVLLLSCAIFLTSVLLGIKRVRDAEVFSKALPTMNFALAMNIALFSASFGYAMFQNNESIFRSDALITTSHADDTNLLMSMTAQRHNSRKVITRYFTKEYEDIFQYTGIETIIGYYRIISNEITKSTISDETAIMTARDQDEFYFVHMVDQQSKLLDRYLGDMMVPEGVRIVAVKRGDGIVYPRLDTRFQKDDAVIVFTSFSKRTDLIRVFGKSSIPEV